MQTTGYAQLGAQAINPNPKALANAPLETELAQILNKLGRINEVLAGNNGLQHSFISRVAPWLHAPPSDTKTGMPESNGTLSAINNQLSLIEEKLAEQSNLTSYLGRIG